MRDFKFRIWNSVIGWTVANNPMHTDFSDDGELRTRDGNTIQQFTGLKDKNGKEIYEGDIIIKDGIYFEIKWNRLGASFYCLPKRLLDRKIRPEFSDLELYEVVGNIFENPKLLKGD